MNHHQVWTTLTSMSHSALIEVTIPNEALVTSQARPRNVASTGDGMAWYKPQPMAKSDNARKPAYVSFPIHTQSLMSSRCSREGTESELMSWQTSLQISSVRARGPLTTSRFTGILPG